MNFEESSLEIKLNNEDQNNDNNNNDQLENASPEARLKKLKKKKNHRSNFNSKDFVTFGQFRLLLL